jgi:hypothetical protein
MANETIANDAHPNGFITEREVNGERRSVRHYKDGRISSRNNSFSGDIPLSRTTSSASARQAKRSTFWDPSATHSVAGDAETPDITSATETFTISEPTPKTQKPSHPVESTEPEVETATLRNVTSASKPASSSSNTSTGSGSVLDRVANIETNIKKFEKTCLGSIDEKME